ncbi:MAG: flippase [Thermoplasmata archaeon]|nr:flippase [Thermoplasmata archaeon]
MMKIETARRLTFDVGWVFISYIVTMAVGLFLKVLLGNFFDAEGLGAYSMVLTIWAIVTITGAFGVPVAIITYVSQNKSKDNVRNTLVTSGLIFGLLVGLLASVIVFILAPYMEFIFNIPNLGRLLRYVAPCFPFVIFNEMFSSYLNAIRHMRGFSLFDIFRNLGLLFVTVAMIWLGFGIEGAVMAMVIMPIATSIVALAYHRKVMTFRFRHFRIYTRRLIKFGSRLYFASAAAMINTQVTVLLIGFYLADTEVGIYSVAIMFFNALVMLPMAMQRVTFPTISGYFAEKRLDKIKILMGMTLKFSFVFLSIMCLLMFYFVDDAIGLLFPGKENFLLAVIPIQILAVMGLVYGTIAPVSILFTAAGKPDIPMKISIAKALVNVTLGVFLVPLSLTFLGYQIGGINGATIALGSSYILEVFLFFMLVKPKLGIRVKANAILRGLAAFIGVLGTGYVIAVCTDIDENISGAGLIFTYVIILMAIGLVTKKDISMGMSIIKKPGQ